MPHFKVNLVHFVEADDADAAIAAAREPGRQPIIGEAFLWGSSLAEQAPPPAAEPDGGEPS
jgi:hypothetical protein